MMSFQYLSAMVTCWLLRLLQKHMTRGEGRWEGRRGYSGIENGDGRRLNLGCKHIIQYTDAIL